MKRLAEDTLRAVSRTEVLADEDAAPDVVDQTVDNVAAGTLSQHVRDRLRDIEHRHALTLASLVQRETEVSALRQRIDYMREEEGNALREMQQALQDARRSHSRAEKAAAAVRCDLQQAEAELRGAQSRARELEQHVASLSKHVATLSATLAATHADVERAAASRAWRYGHRLTRIASRMMLRKHRTDGALVAALERIEDVQSSVLALPMETCRAEQAVRSHDD